MNIIRRPKGGAYAPERTPVEKTIAVSCRLPISLLKRLKIEAASRKCSMSTLLYSILVDRDTEPR